MSRSSTKSGFWSGDRICFALDVGGKGLVQLGSTVAWWLVLTRRLHLSLSQVTIRLTILYFFKVCNVTPSMFITPVKLVYPENRRVDTKYIWIWHVKPNICEDSVPSLTNIHKFAKSCALQAEAAAKRPRQARPKSQKTWSLFPFYFFERGQMGSNKRSVLYFSNLLSNVMRMLIPEHGED